MAKTRKPVSLLIHPILDGPEMEKLREQGHKVDIMTTHIPPQTATESPSGYLLNPHALVDLEYDLILGPNCWWLPPEHIDLLPTALKAARETRYPPTEKKSTKRAKKHDK